MEPSKINLISIHGAAWVCSYKLQPDCKRQIFDFYPSANVIDFCTACSAVLNFQIPGDFLGLSSILLRTSDHSFEPIVDILAIEVPKRDLLDAFSETPRLDTAILWAASRDEAMVVEHLVRLGSRDAYKRLAHFLLELVSRLTLVGMADRSGYACPLTQFHLADALGLTSVHVNRTLRKLREAGLVVMREGRVEIMDLDGIIKLADFDPAYLNQTGPLLV